MAIGVASRCKINANIGNSATARTSTATEKLEYSIKYGADNVMDLSTGGNIPDIRQAIIDASPVPSARCRSTKPSRASGASRT